MEQKLSEIIFEMIKPYHKGNDSHIETLISIAVTCWNITLIPKEERIEFYNSMLESLSNDDESKQVSKSLIAYFIRTKMELYSEDKRFIVDYQYDTSSQPPNLHIVSAVLSDTISQDRGKKAKIGRNDPCPCGSGKKYKKCCGK